jgi:hypothetical protein
MGQRLIVTIKKDNEDLAKIYFHWSAYTYSALLETKKIINCIYNHEDETVKELQLRLIKFIENNGGGIKGDESEFKYIQNLYPNEVFKTLNYSRSYGLIALSKEGMKDLQDWSEGDVVIDLDTDTVENTVYGWWDDICAYNEERKEWDDDDFEGYELEDIEDIGCDIGQFNVEDIDNILAALYNVDGICRNGKDIFEMIE